MRAPIGLRVRNLRKAKGLSQTGLAKAVGISPAYLNLIEANKRDVGGSLVQRIAAELDVELNELTGESEQRLINELQEAFSDPILEPLKLDGASAHQLVAIMPEIARALHLSYRGYLEATASANAYAHRLNSDPLFSELLHKMLSRITAVRSAAEIVEQVADLTEVQRQGFFATISGESRELSDISRTLIAEFSREVEAHRSITPAREINDLLIEERNFFPALEDEASRLLAEASHGDAFSLAQLVEKLEDEFGIRFELSAAAPAPSEHGFGYDRERSVMWFRRGTPQATIRFRLAQRYAALRGGELIADLTHDSRLTSPQSRSLAVQALAAYLAGALLFPYDRFFEDAEQNRYDLDHLAQRHAASFEQVAHRLMTLRKPGAEGIPFGFLRADPAGYLSKQFPLPGLVMPNSGHGCPLWVLYGALRAPDIINRQSVSFSDGSRYLFIAKATAKRVASFTERPTVSSVMLACDILHADRTVYADGLDLGDIQADSQVGPACRLCVRHGCAHRHEAVAANIAG